MKAHRIRLAVAALVIVLIMMADGEQVNATVVTFSSQSAFINAGGSLTSGPLNAPFVGGGQPAITVGGGIFTISPGPGVPSIGVSNTFGNSLPSDLEVEGVGTFSDLDFTFSRPVTGFALTVSNFTSPGFTGPSLFGVTLFDNSAQVGTTGFSTPAFGEVFFGVLSSQPFNFLTLREVSGGPQRGSPFSGEGDIEFFGNFFAVPEPGTLILLGSGLAGLIGFRRKRLFEKV